MLNNRLDEAEVYERERVIFIKGATTFETVAAIQKKIVFLIQKNSSLSFYQIDLTDVKEVNSAALGLLVELKKVTIAYKKTIVFLNAPERLLSLAQVCGVASWLGF